MAGAALAVLAALFVVAVARGPLSSVERVFVLAGVGLLALGVGLAIRLLRRPRPRLMDGRFEGDVRGSAPHEDAGGEVTAGHSGEAS